MQYIFSDVNEALMVMWDRMWSVDEEDVFVRPSRNGPVHEARLPVMTTFTNPRRRVLFCEGRDANPFFHLFEAIWMLAGRSDVRWLAQFNKQMLEYSDDGETIAGSNYGFRWREPLEVVIRDLKKDPNSRRAFIPIFTPYDNQRHVVGTKDLPCNTGISFLQRGPQLDMTVFNRSNDMLLGAYGANYVHFGFLQEYVACLLGLRVGTFTQVSSCFHMYTEFPVTKRIKAKGGPARTNRYDTWPHVKPSNIMVLNSEPHYWQQDAEYFMRVYGTVVETDPALANDCRIWHEPFFDLIVAPMYRAWHAMIKERNYGKAVEEIRKVRSPDWQIAGAEWIYRRQAERTRKEKAA